MRRKKTPLVLLSIFVLAPVLLIAVLGMLAIRAFESTSATFRLNGLVEQLLANVADEVDATFASDPSRLPGFLPIASPETLAVNL